MRHCGGSLKKKEGKESVPLSKTSVHHKSRLGCKGGRAPLKGRMEINTKKHCSDLCISGEERRKEEKDAEEKKTGKKKCMEEEALPAPSRSPLPEEVEEDIQVEEQHMNTLSIPHVAYEPHSTVPNIPEEESICEEIGEELMMHDPPAWNLRPRKKIR
jgi:hypothetical protein